MKELDYSPALNEAGTEFDIVKAAEIAKGYSDAGLRAAVEDTVRRWMAGYDADWAMAEVRAALASSPAPAGLDVERLRRALEIEWMERVGDPAWEDDDADPMALRAPRIAAEYDRLRAATRPAEYRCPLCGSDDRTEHNDEMHAQERATRPAEDAGE